MIFLHSKINSFIVSMLAFFTKIESVKPNMVSNPYFSDFFCICLCISLPYPVINSDTL
jgi:hypothetical protein